MSASTREIPFAELPGQRPYFKVVSHSNLFYWWPVWAFGFAMAAISYADGDRLAIVPEGSRVKTLVDVRGLKSFELTVPGKPTDSLSAAAQVPSGQEPFPYRIAHNTTLNLVYAIVVLVVILASMVTLRGLWSVINLMAILLLAGLCHILGWWGAIIGDLGQLHFYVSGATYFFTSLVLFSFWAVIVFVFDQRRFIIFSPGQIIVHAEIGDRQEVHDTSGVTVVKRLNDFIRHRVLGLGAGDLIISTSDGRHVIELDNVLFADNKVREIAEVMKTRPVLAE